MSGVTQAVFMNQRSFAEPAPTVIGQAFGGGFYAGQISTAGNGVASHYLVAAPKSSGENSSRQWKTSATSTSGTSSVIDGPSNTSAMNDASHPAAQFCAGLSIGGFSDWYMPAKNELEVCYFNLKPTTDNNNTNAFSGDNANAVPSRAGPYTTTNPAQTSATDFQNVNSEAFNQDSNGYWSSTQTSDSNASVKVFTTGSQFNGGKNAPPRYVRAVRRVPV